MKSTIIIKQIFLSHEKNDEDLKKLARALASELQRREFDVWSDKRILPGDDWSSKIKKALNESDAMIALLNQHSFSSSYVRNELEHAFFDGRYKNRLLPVLIGSTSEEDFSKLPWVLTKMKLLQIKEKQPIENLARKIADSFQDLLSGWEGKNA